jgi:hypothetical protein
MKANTLEMNLKNFQLCIQINSCMNHSFSYYLSPFLLLLDSFEVFVQAIDP